jgi:hypothetical protein
MSGKNYNSGKKFEKKKGDAYIKQHGLVRPTAAQRKVIEAAILEGLGIKINRHSYDLIAEEAASHCTSVMELLPMVEDIILYEMKSANVRQDKPVGEDWKGMGFTLSGKETENWRLLGDKRFKFVFVDFTNGPGRHLVLNYGDFYTNARVYQTESVFINKPLLAG